MTKELEGSLRRTLQLALEADLRSALELREALRIAMALVIAQGAGLKVSFSEKQANIEFASGSLHQITVEEFVTGMLAIR
jgi:hypothetical protein